jgi:uncharacterized protein (DUF433 family)
MSWMQKMRVQAPPFEGSAGVEDEAMSGQPYVGVGLYTLPEAARLIRAPIRKLTRWAEGYTFMTEGKGKFSEPLFTRDHPELATQRILTFADLMELQLVSMFRKLGVSMPTIRAAAQWAAHEFGTNHPFAVKRFHTDGKRLFAEREYIPAGEDSPVRFYQELPRYQLVLDTIAEPFFKMLDYQGEEVRHFWPLGRERGVVLDPDRSFGKPIDSTSGVPTFVLYQMAAAGESLEGIAQWYNVKPDAVKAAIEYELSLAACHSSSTIRFRIKFLHCFGCWTSMRSISVSTSRRTRRTLYGCRRQVAWAGS